MAETIPGAATGPKCSETQRAFIRALLLSQTPEGYNSLCRAIAEAEQPDYARSRSPLLIIAGSHDKTSPIEGAQKILDRLAVYHKHPTTDFANSCAVGAPA
jgi:pimeloyl-ACP methyl ester carboxylesterase